jgi:hypothetical protein
LEKALKSEDNLVITLLVRPDHYVYYNAGKKTSWGDPIALALRERLNLPYTENCDCGEDTLHFTRDHKMYTADFDIKGFHSRWQNIPRSVTLKFKRVY